MGQKQIKRARREIRLFCAEQHRRTQNGEQPLDPRVLGAYPAKTVKRVVSQYMIDNGLAGGEA